MRNGLRAVLTNKKSYEKLQIQNCLIATIYLAFMTLMIPAMFFMFTDPTATNLALASLLTAVSGLASYNYFLTYKNK
jgi:preprotein translocase subunit SecF